MSTIDGRNKRLQEVVVNLENIRLIWLHDNADDNDQFEWMSNELKALNPAAEFTNNSTECLQIIQWIRGEYVFLIVSESLLEHIYAEIDNIRTEVAIFVVLEDNQDQTQIPKSNKIVAVINDLENAIDAVQLYRSVIENNLGFRVVKQNEESVSNLTSDPMSFVWYQILINVLLQIPSSQESKQEMMDVCRAYSANTWEELTNIQKFEKTYTSDRAIDWYTSNCFLSKILNRAFHTENIFHLYIFRFYFIDLWRQIEEKRESKMDDESLVVYHGQQISENNLKLIQDSIGNIISFNGFVSTTQSKKVAINLSKRHEEMTTYATESSRFTKSLHAVLFEIKVDPSSTNAAFVDVSRGSKRKAREILFGLNTCFKIISVDEDQSDDRWNIRLNVTDWNRAKFQDLQASVDEQIEEYTPLIYLGRLLLYEYDRIDQAKHYFEYLIKTPPSNNKIHASICEHLGHVENQNDELKKALEYYQKAYKIYTQYLPPQHPLIVRSLRHLSAMYERKGYLNRALRYSREVSLIQDRLYPGDHLEKALTLESLGIVYRAKRNSDKALSYLSDAYKIYKRVLPSAHHHIAQCLGYIGLVHEDKNKLEKALSYYEQQFDIEKKCLPWGHRYIAEHIRWIAQVHMKLNHQHEAKIFCQKQSDDAEKLLGDTHPHVARVKILVGELIEAEDPEGAYNSYKTAVSILNVKTTPDDRSLIRCYLSMADWNDKHNNTTDTVKYDELAINIARESLSPNHIDLAFALKNLGISYMKFDQWVEAKNCFTESLSIYQQNYASDHRAMKLYTIMIQRLIEPVEVVNIDENKSKQTIPVIARKNIVNSSQQSLQLDESMLPSVLSEDPPDSSTTGCIIL